MGLFSDEIRTYVSTTVSRVIPDTGLPDAIKTGVIKAIFADGGIPEYAVEEMIGSIGIRADRMYEYARTTYTHGLPSGQFKTNTLGMAEATDVLTSLEGVTILPLYCHYGPPNKLHIGWLKLLKEHGYNPANNQLAILTTAKRLPVYLDNMTVIVPAAARTTYTADALAQWGIPATAGYTPERPYQGLAGNLRAPTPVLFDSAATEAYVRVDYVWVAPNNSPEESDTIMKASFNINLTGYDSAADYFHVKYSVNGLIKYWMYQDNLGTYPALDAVFITEPQTNGTFFPFTYFRYNKRSEVADKTTTRYKTSKKLVKYLGIDYDTVATAIDENPGITDVEQAMMTLAVPANTTNELERRYLFSFFEAMFQADGNQFISPTQAEMSAALWGNTSTARTSLIIQDARFKMVLSHGGIFKKLVVGSIGAIGSHDSGFFTTLVAQHYIDSETNKDVTHQISVPQHYYRRQISTNLYAEIQVSDLRMLYYIFGGYFTTGDELDAILLIPLDRSITHTYSISDRETLYARSLHYVFNSRTVVVLAWYQQGWFGDLLQIAAIVVIIASFGSATGPMASLMAAVASGSTVLITAAVMAVLEHLLIGFLLGMAFKIFAKAVGADIAILFAVVAAAMGAYQILEAGSVAGAPWATTLLQVSSGLTNGIKSEIQELYGELIEETTSFNLFKDEATKALEAANKLLEHNNWLNPFVIFGEKPDDYYNRTIHSGNIGVLGIGAISYYVDTALTLPKLDETIEG